jgi:hypothetical protein
MDHLSTIICLCDIAKSTYGVFLTILLILYYKYREIKKMLKTFFNRDLKNFIKSEKMPLPLKS